MTQIEDRRMEPVLHWYTYTVLRTWEKPSICRVGYALNLILFRPQHITNIISVSFTARNKDSRIHVK